MNPAAIIALIVGAWYLLSRTSAPSSTSGIGTAATTSPIGSTSGVLTPTSTAVAGGLSTIDAFLEGLGPGQTSTQVSNTLTQGAINSSIGLSSGDEIDYGAAYTDEESAPTIDTSGNGTEDTTDYLSGVGL
jgi:hypothetical protein